ncbi:MAG TPA: hypothetical protein VHZ73_10240 [Vicinamibacterales bacterium]|jgi:hypothetical protein|nr:hypothetical protein [Vicinamibacterales bacterium]
MTIRRSRVVFGALACGGAAVLAVALAMAPRPSAAAGAPLPASLSDQDFWRFVTDHSEPSGSFPRENLTSNETMFQYVIPDLLKRATAGGVYLGVGPEQNFTYMTALKPAMAIIFDIRRGNLDVQLMYKAIFELSADRADYVSMLFSRPRPAGLTTSSSAVDLFGAYDRVAGSKTLHDRNLQAIEDRLKKVHGFGMSAADIEWVEYVFDTFYRDGFRIRPSPAYDELMTAADQAGMHRSYLASEANFAWLKQLEARNLVVPLVGDFAGSKAIREVAAYLTGRDATVSAFYLSNVEDYLYQDGQWDAFCRNVAMLPLSASSTFIRSTSRGRAPGGFGGFGVGFVSSLGSMAMEVRSCR